MFFSLRGLVAPSLNSADARRAATAKYRFAQRLPDDLASANQEVSSMPEAVFDNLTPTRAIKNLTADDLIAKMIVATHLHRHIAFTLQLSTVRSFVLPDSSITQKRTILDVSFSKANWAMSTISGAAALSPWMSSSAALIETCCTVFGSIAGSRCRRSSAEPIRPAIASTSIALPLRR
jgi:hypothetical protein